MKRILVCTILVLALLVNCVPVTAADYDLLLGDVDGDGSLTAGDARTVLRASVGLDTLDKDKQIIADVDFKDSVSAGDARMILRASVGLENIDNFYHTHDMQDISVAGSCTEATIRAEKCTTCGMTILSEVTEAPGHAWSAYSQMGDSHYRSCARCNAEEAAGRSV